MSSSGTEYAKLLEEKKSLKVDIEHLKAVNIAANEELDKLKKEVEDNEQSISDLMKLLKDFHDNPSFPSDYLQVLQDARSLWLSNWLLQEDGFITEVGKNSTAYKQKAKTLQSRTDIVPLLRESLDWYNLYLHRRDNDEYPTLKREE